MPVFPSAPVSPQQLLEGFLAEALAEAEPPEGARAIELQLGVRLEGEGGGEWLVESRGGRVSLRSGARETAAFSYVQSVADWRGALWEGRGGAVGKAVSALFRPGSGEARAAASLGAPAIPALLEALGPLRGLIRVEVTGGDAPWQVALLLGPGPIPPEPTTTLSISAEDADQLARGELKPLEAFLAGRIRVIGDMGLLLQLQAAQLQGAQALAGARRDA